MLPTSLYTLPPDVFKDVVSRGMPAPCGSSAGEERRWFSGAIIVVLLTLPLTAWWLIG